MFGGHVTRLDNALLGDDGADKVALYEILQPEEDRVRELAAPTFEVAVHVCRMRRILLPVCELQCIPMICKLFKRGAALSRIR